MHRRRISCGNDDKLENGDDEIDDWKSRSNKGKIMYNFDSNEMNQNAFLPSTLLMGRLNDRPKTNQFRGKPTSKM